MKISEVDSCISKIQNLLALHSEERAFPEGMGFDLIKEGVDVIFFKTIQNLYYIVMDYPTTTRLMVGEGRLLKNPDELKDFQQNFEHLRSLSNKIEQVSKVRVGNKAGVQMDVELFPRESYSAFLDHIIEFVSMANYVSSVGKNKEDKQYPRLLTKNLPYMVKKLSSASEMMDKLNMYSNQDYSNIFNDTVRFFSECSDVLLEFVTKLKEEDQKREQEGLHVAKVVVPRQVETSVSPKEDSRRKAISRANDMYQEFCMDFMRDLHAQYSLSSRDMYEHFVNVKFKKFVERYPMPIASDASEGYANEVIYQIQNLMDYVSKISENSYVTSVYDKN